MSVVFSSGLRGEVVSLLLVRGPRRLAETGLPAQCLELSLQQCPSPLQGGAEHQQQHWQHLLCAHLFCSLHQAVITLLFLCPVSGSLFSEWGAKRQPGDFARDSPTHHTSSNAASTLGSLHTAARAASTAPQTPTTTPPNTLIQTTPTRRCSTANATCRAPARTRSPPPHQPCRASRQPPWRTTV